jgi:hypothetical protein
LGFVGWQAALAASQAPKPRQKFAGLSALRQNFCHADLRVAMKLIGPVQYAQFHVAQGDDPDEFEKRRRDAASLVTAILQAIDARRTPKEPAIA